jgi:peptidoglycan glycosyltransferase
MNKQKGAVVAIDPTTGAILAAVSLPSYDPNLLSSHDTAAISAYWNSLNPNDQESALQNRDFNVTFAPGSVFKVVVSAAALKAGVKPTDQIPAVNAYWPLGGSGACPKTGSACVENFDGETCDPASGGTTASLEFAFAKSCNTAFAQLAVTKLGGSAIANEAKLFGLDNPTLKVPLTVAGSTIGTQQDLTDKAALAQTSFGQRDVRITPLEGAMIASAVANNGVLNQPFLVDQERAPDLSVLSNGGPSRANPVQLSTVLSPALDQELAQMMVGVVQDPEGTGGSAKITDIPNITVGGKTGTADTGFYDANGNPTPPHAWFVGFADRSGVPKIAVAVIVENGGVNGSETTGGLAAAPIAKAVMEAYLNSPEGQ